MSQRIFRVLLPASRWFSEDRTLPGADPDSVLRQERAEGTGVWACADSAVCLGKHFRSQDVGATDTPGLLVLAGVASREPPVQSSPVCSHHRRRKGELTALTEQAPGL